METKDQYSASTLKKLILDTIKNEMLIEPELASDDAYYEAVCRVIRRILTERYKVFNAHANSVATKKVYYMSMEFLRGRSLKNSLYNLGIQDEMSEALKQLDVDIAQIFELEPDAGLGNGGLGRLAACYLDSMATENLSAMGYSLLY